MTIIVNSHQGWQSSEGKRRDLLIAPLGRSSPPLPTPGEGVELGERGTCRPRSRASPLAHGRRELGASELALALAAPAPCIGWRGVTLEHDRDRGAPDPPCHHVTATKLCLRTALGVLHASLGVWPSAETRRPGGCSIWHLHCLL
jgi:hypothetical protein